MTLPWYSEGGLRFSCTRCGLCCRGPTPGHVWVSDEDVARLATRLRLSSSDLARRYLRLVDGALSLVERENADCVFYEEGTGCTVYDDRPRQCRTFPFWPRNLASEEAWKAVRGCQGVGNGRAYESAEVDGFVRGEGQTGS